MTKEQFINRMAKNGGIKKIEAYRYVNLFIDTLLECLKEEGKVKFQGFGKFEVRTAKERVGRNPKNGNTCIIPKHKAVKFKVGKRFSDEVNKERVNK